MKSTGDDSMRGGENIWLKKKRAMGFEGWKALQRVKYAKRVESEHRDDGNG